MVRLLRVLPTSIAETHTQAKRDMEQARSNSSTGSNSVDSVVYLGTFPTPKSQRPGQLMRAKEWRARAQADLLLAKDQDFIRGADGVDLVQEEDEVNSPCPWERRSRGQAVQGNADPKKTVESASKEVTVRALSSLAAPSCKGLLNVLVQLDGREVQATISTGTAHNFMAEKVARELGLTIVFDDTLKVTGAADVEGALGRTEATMAIGLRQG